MRRRQLSRFEKTIPFDAHHDVRAVLTQRAIARVDETTSRVRLRLRQLSRVMMIHQFHRGFATHVLLVPLRRRIVFEIQPVRANNFSRTRAWCHLPEL